MTTTFRHPEAFRLLRYRCEPCGFVEVVWNSRDGCVPSIIECAAASRVLCDEVVSRGAVIAAPTTVHLLRLAIEHWGGEIRKLTPCGGSAVRLPVDRDDRDQFPTAHDPYPGERYFRDGIPAEARASMRAQTDRWGISEELRRNVIRVAGTDDSFELQPG
jgi:hypothetical protein